MASQEALSGTAETGGMKHPWWQRLKPGAPGSRGLNQSVPMPLIVFTIVVLVVYVIVVAWASFRDPPRIKGKAEIRFNNYVAGLEKDAKGDFSKLTPAEQKKLNQETMGHGAMMFKDQYLHPPN